MPESSTKVAGRYRLIQRIAAGGMGEVFLAVQDGPEGFQKLVALKRIRPGLAHPTAVEHFLDEARLVSRLTHRNIAQLFDFGQDSQGYFVAMEFVRGPTLAALLARLMERGIRFPPTLALDVVSQVAEALAFAWTLPGPDGGPLHVVHRDVSPQNVMVSVAGDVKLIDFGVARNTQQEHVSRLGTLKGKLQYMSPEQARGGASDARSDLFCLGIVLCELLSGVHPFRRDDRPVSEAIQHDEPELPSTRDPSLAFLDPTLRRLLAKEPSERFQDGHQLSEALQALRRRLPAESIRLGQLVSDCFGSELEDLVTQVRQESATIPAAAEGSLSWKPRHPVALSEFAAPSTSPRVRLGDLGVVGGGAMVGLVAGLLALSLTNPRASTPLAPAPTASQRSPVAEPPSSPPPPVSAPPTRANTGALQPTSPPPRPEAPVGARPSPFELVATLPSGTTTLPLTSGVGTVRLGETSGLELSLDYRADAHGLHATLRSEPWTIVSIDGESVGKTPVELPGLADRVLDLDLRRPGMPPVQVFLRARRSE